MKRLKYIGSVICLFAGMILTAGGAEAMHYPCIGVGIGVFWLGCLIAKSTEREGDEDGGEG